MPKSQKNKAPNKLRALEKRIGQNNLAKMMNVTPRSVRRYKDGTRSMGKAQKERLAVINKLYNTVKPSSSAKLRKKRFDSYSAVTSPKLRFFRAKSTGDLHFKIKLTDPLELKKYTKVAKKLGMGAAYVAIKGQDDKGYTIARNTRYTEIDRPEDLLLDIDETEEEYSVTIITETVFHAVKWD
jgi:hypothetical protein